MFRAPVTELVVLAHPAYFKEEPKATHKHVLEFL